MKLSLCQNSCCPEYESNSEVIIIKHLEVGEIISLSHNEFRAAIEQYFAEHPDFLMSFIRFPELKQ